MASAAGLLEEIYSIDHWEALPKMTCATTIIRASNGLRWSEGAIQRLDECVRAGNNCSSKVIEGGHWVHVDAPKKVADAVCDLCCNAQADAMHCYARAPSCWSPNSAAIDVELSHLLKIPSANVKHASCRMISGAVRGVGKSFGKGYGLSGIVKQHGSKCRARSGQICH